MIRSAIVMIVVTIELLTCQWIALFASWSIVAEFRLRELNIQTTTVARRRTAGNAAGAGAAASDVDGGHGRDRRHHPRSDSIHGTSSPAVGNLSTPSSSPTMTSTLTTPHNHRGLSTLAWHSNLMI